LDNHVQHNDSRKANNEVIVISTILGLFVGFYHAIINLGIHTYAAILMKNHMDNIGKSFGLIGLMEG